MESIISANLKRILTEYNLNQNELARIAGVSESAAGKWILGKSTPRMGAIQKIADHFNLPKSYILQENPTNLIETSPQTVRIPILGTIACGDPILAEENIEGFMYEIADSLPSGNLFGLIAKGNSMEPTIPNGSKVLIREQNFIEYGEISAVLLNGDTEATLKRVKKQGNIIMLMPDNPQYEPTIITEDNPAKIIGKAIRLTRDLI
ncbi:helix-turn-helix domain-containing protein [Viridibacillus sp. YIM B01967]|uniref:Helix-turn-helix domain-containing protein n=2 Tax=Viridibacillus soli TaxID=2798301 RepID=A0ABS1H269_9BACL|nr:helix-turn-helix domain-containing protein [Viridibacillus soli]